MRNVNLFLAVFVFGLAGCTTIQTHIDDRDEYYETPIELKHRFIFSSSYIMGVHRMEDKARVVDIYEGANGRILTRGFTYYYGNASTSRIEITQRETRKLFFAGVKYFVSFIDNNGRSVEYEVNFNEGNYLTVQDNDIGTIEFNHYMNNGIHTGFDIIVNDERFGILAFYPVPFSWGSPRASLFVRRGNELKSDMALYVLAVYLSHITR